MEQRSIFSNLKMVVQGVADAACSATQAVGTTAESLDELSRAGLVMAKSNRKIVEIQTAGKERKTLAELSVDFPDLATDFPELAAASKSK